MPLTKRQKELGQPNPVKGDAWLRAKTKALSKKRMGQAAPTRNSEGYFTSIYAFNADPYEDPHRIQKRFQRVTSGPAFKSRSGKKLQGEGFDAFQSLYTGHKYQDPLKIRMKMKKDQRDHALRLAPKDVRGAFKTGGGYKKPTHFDRPLFLLEVDAETDKKKIDAIRKEKEKLRLQNLRKPFAKPNIVAPSIPKGGYGVSGQLIGRKNPTYTESPYERLEQSKADYLRGQREKQRKVHGDTHWVHSPLVNPNTSLVTVGTFTKDTEAFGLNPSIRKKLDELAAMRSQPRVLTLPNWLTQYRLIKFQDDLAGAGLKKPKDVAALSESQVTDVGKRVGMRGAERQRFTLMRDRIATSLTGGQEARVPWRPNNPGKAGGNSLIDPKATFSSYPPREEPKPISKAIVEREKRMYSVLPEFENMNWNTAGAVPLRKSNPSVLNTELDTVQRAVLAVSKVGKFGPAVSRGPKLYSSIAASDNRLAKRPW